MIRIEQVKLEIKERKMSEEEALARAAARSLGIRREQIRSLEIKKRSLDARRKPRLFYVYTVEVGTEQEERLLKKNRAPNLSCAQTPEYRLPPCGAMPLSSRPVVVGTGPAGLFCALALAKAGFCPLVLERGEEIAQRQKAVAHFWETGELNPESNVQFGEGGAGTFSDGKLNTGVRDAGGRGAFILRTFVECGAPSDILWNSRPHIGTDQLCTVVHNLCEQIERLGGEIRFRTKLTDLTVQKGRITGLVVNGTQRIPCEVLILAPGHSARDTFRMLLTRGAAMEQKPFAVGVRIEHPQEMIDRAQYGRSDPLLPAADYRLTCRLSNGRGAYSFCMCPGGYVVNASSEPGRIAVNGMSLHARDGENANSAIVVTVTPKDFHSSDVLAGVAFQRALEEAAYRAGDGDVPVQCFGDFCAHRQSTGPGRIFPSVKGRYAYADVRGCFPNEIADSIFEAIRMFGEKIPGFDRADALLFAAESRTSSPVRIVRGADSLESCLKGLYPCGEGAGYAGGITSAAMDGLKVAEAVIRKFIYSL